MYPWNLNTNLKQGQEGLEVWPLEPLARAISRTSHLRARDTVFCFGYLKNLSVCVLGYMQLACTLCHMRRRIHVCVLGYMQLACTLCAFVCRLVQLTTTHLPVCAYLDTCSLHVRRVRLRDCLCMPVRDVRLCVWLQVKSCIHTHARARTHTHAHTQGVRAGANEWVCDEIKKRQRAWLHVRRVRLCAYSFTSSCIHRSTQVRLRRMRKKRDWPTAAASSMTSLCKSIVLGLFCQ